MFEAICDGPQSERGLVEIATELVGESLENEQWTGAVKQLLITLDSLGLIRPCRY